MTLIEAFELKVNMLGLVHEADNKRTWIVSELLTGFDSLSSPSKIIPFLAEFSSFTAATSNS